MRKERKLLLHRLRVGQTEDRSDRGDPGIDYRSDDPQAKNRAVTATKAAHVSALTACMGDWSSITGYPLRSTVARLKLRLRSSKC